MAHHQCHCARVTIIPFVILASGFVKQVLSMRSGKAEAAAIMDVDASDTLILSSQTCIYGQEKCCCQGSSCMKFFTGQDQGEDVCSCQDEAAMKLLGIDGEEPKTSLQETACAAIDRTDIIRTEEPAGSCGLARLYELESEDEHFCKHKTLEKIEPLTSKLDNSKLLSFDERITGGAIMGCTALEKVCTAPGSWSPSGAMKRLIDAGLDFTVEHMRRSMVRLGMYWSGVSWEDSGVLSKWAFTHGEANNPFCKDDDNETDASHSAYTHMLHKVLMMKNDGSEEQTSEQLISGTEWSDALKAAIKSMLVADCPSTRTKKTPTKTNLKGGVAIDDLKLTSSQWSKHAWLKTLLEYVQDPLVERTLEEERVDLIRDVLLIMDKLLVENEIDTTMPPELEGMWRRLSTATHGERLWDDVHFNFAENDAKPRCKCDDIEESLAVHLLNLMPQLGLDFGTVALDKSGHLTTDKTPVPPSLKYMGKEELQEFVHRMAISEAGLWDPKFAVKYIVQSLRDFNIDVDEHDGDDEHGGDDEPPSPTSELETQADDEFIPEGVSHQGLVKGVLVGFPILQNMMAVFGDADENDKVAFAKKMDWFFVMNIMWAVNHALDDKMSAMDILLGLATTLLSLLNSFGEGYSYLLQMTGDLSFVEFQLAVYTVWNYRFVMGPASGEDPEIYWMHGTTALSMPLLQSIANHGDVRHWANYRRDNLFHTLMAHTKKSLAKEKAASAIDTE